MSGWHPAWILAAALGGGVAGGLAVRFTASDAAKRPAPRASAEPANRAGAEADDDLADRVETLERAVAGLDSRRRAAQTLQNYGKAMAAGDGDGGAAPAAGHSVDDPVFEAAVRDIMDQTRVERRAERRQRRMDGWVSDLTDELSLSAEQQQKVKTALAQVFEELRAAREADGGGEGEGRGRRREMRRRADEKLKEILTPEQLEKYKTRQEERGGGGGGRRRGRGGGDREE